jgi:hypothetical protein
VGARDFVELGEHIGASFVGSTSQHQHHGHTALEQSLDHSVSNEAGATSHESTLSRGHAPQNTPFPPAGFLEAPEIYQSSD